MNQLWQYWHAQVSDEMIDAIVTASEKYPVSNAGMGFDGSTQNNDARHSEIRWVNPTDTNNSFITDMLWYYAREANRNAFGFDVDYLPDIQYTKYSADENGKYDWHCDTFWANPTTYDRKISIVIQLTDPSEYEGGNFEFDPQYPQIPLEHARAKGTVIVFPSFINHRVTPVTSGVRHSLVSWIQGPKFR